MREITVVYMTRGTVTVAVTTSKDLHVSTSVIQSLLPRDNLTTPSVPTCVPNNSYKLYHKNYQITEAF